MNSTTLNTARTVFLGDSITDGNSYCALVAQALAGIGVDVHPINAGIGGDTARGMLSRLERDVFAYNPTLVTISSGPNDTHQGIPLADYASSIAAIVDQVLRRDIYVLLMTTSTLADSKADLEATLVEYNAFLRALAADQGLPVADVYGLMRRAKSEGAVLLEDDGVHPNRAGHDAIARAVLDGLGFPELAVPDRIIAAPLPGLVTPWRLRGAKTADALTQSETAALAVDDSWAAITLPQSGPASIWWLTDERNRGFAVDIEQIAGAASLYHGVAEVISYSDCGAFLNTGAGLEAVWLNDEEVYRRTAHHGWHAGRDRIPVRLNAGANRLVIETGTQFFLSITDDNQW